LSTEKSKTGTNGYKKAFLKKGNIKPLWNDIAFFFISPSAAY